MSVILNDAQKAALKAIADGAAANTFVFSNAKSMKFYLDNGLVEANTEIKDDKGNNPYRPSAAGAALLANVGGTPPVEGTAPEGGAAAPAKPNLFVMQKVAPLAIKRTPPKGPTTPREPKYPLADLEEGFGLFIPADVQEKAKSKAKGFGSMVSTFNDKNADKYLTSRFVEDGAKAGFGPHNEDGTPAADNPFIGVAGTGIYRLPVADKPARKTAAAAAANPAGGTPPVA